MTLEDPAPDQRPLPTALISIGYVEAKLSDYATSPDYAKRLADPAGFLAFSADFVGDGRLDRARVLRNVERNIAYVVVVLQRGQIDTHVIESMPFDQVEKIGIRVASPSDESIRAAGITIFSLDGQVSRTFDLVDDDFQQRAEP
ncbi:hypothetical protein [Phenylobacterium sp.]|uniref:hypothetical protein n=1 Tax=Phenylobacterium sp. TaxID=1871053 RepID=UPI00272F778C|nr:hypothetical protein [Phenylobacterium sp.]MDP1874420.1 hypothetical protein [Phenylobacterium sp.]